MDPKEERDFLSTLSVEAIVNIFVKCNLLNNIWALGSTSRRIAAVWKAHRVMILWKVSMREIPAFKALVVDQTRERPQLYGF